MKGSFAPATLRLPSRAKFIRELQHAGIPKRVAIKQYRKLRQDEVWISKRLGVQVNIDKNPSHGFPCEVWHLSIKYRDRRPIHDWRVLQQVKNELVGPECEAFELYPTEERVVDTANQYHLFAFPDGTTRIPCGFAAGMRSDTSLLNSVQRPFDDKGERQ